MVAVVGSKFEGTGFEKVQMGQTQVALLAGFDSGAGRWKGLSLRPAGDAVALLEGVLRAENVLFWKDARFAAFGMSVTLAEDLRKPACISSVRHLPRGDQDLRRTHIYPHPSGRSPTNSSSAHRYRRSICGEMSGRRGRSGALGS
jgi:hypothetical protein